MHNADWVVDRTGADVRALKAKYPGRPGGNYVNNSAEGKAEPGICGTAAFDSPSIETLDPSLVGDVSARLAG